METKMKSNTKKQSSKKSKKQEIPTSNEKYDFFSLPVVKAEVRPALEEKAKELDLLINPYMTHKIVWSENHEGRCMCDWMNRKCPCDNIQKDLTEYDGECLCKVLVTKEKMKKIEEKIKNKKKKKNVKIKDTIIDDDKIKEVKELAKKLGCAKVVKK